MKRYVLWQRVHSPTSIVGSINAENLVEAANLARGMYGSFHITEWSQASFEHRQLAACMDVWADQREALGRHVHEN